MLIWLTVFADLFAMATSLWMAFYLVARGFPSRVTLRVVIVPLSLSSSSTAYLPRGTRFQGDLDPLPIDPPTPLKNQEQFLAQFQTWKALFQRPAHPKL